MEALEHERFSDLQSRFPEVFRAVFQERRAPHTVVVVPSLSLDKAELEKISGVHHYEERLLCMLMLLRLPRTRVVFVTSTAVDPAVVDYYLHLLVGVPGAHARERLVLLHCADASLKPLSQKILERPRLLGRIRRAISGDANAHLAVFNATEFEARLAVALGIPLYASDPALNHLGTKSGSRRLFRKAGIPIPDGAEDLRDEQDIVDTLVELKKRDPGLKKAVVKLNDGFSGEGNATFRFEGAPSALKSWVAGELPKRLCFEAATEVWPRYLEKFQGMGGAAEAFIEGQTKRSPSVQCRIDPLREVDMISTHDQVLGGPTGQVFLGCRFPADDAYRLQIQDLARRVAEVAQSESVLGRFGVDFVSTLQDGRWKHYAIEINLRKGGTTHPFMMLQFLTDGQYNAETGLFLSAHGVPLCYEASDNLCSPDYIGLTPRDLVDISVVHGLHFNSAAQEGTVFHLMGALSEFGKLGVMSIAQSLDHANRLQKEARAVLDRAATDPLR